MLMIGLSCGYKEYNMEFLKIIGSVGDSSYTAFKFTPHEPSLVCIGDMVWSNGTTVEISCDIDVEDLMWLVSGVKNYKSFKGALRLTGFFD